MNDNSKEIRKTLVMWSGGLDSTYGLVRLLRETNDEVFAHHIHRHARHDSGKHVALTCEHEAEAIKYMLPYIQKTYRTFHYSESTIDMTAFYRFARDTATAMFFASQAAKSFGFHADDRILFSMNSDEDKEWNPGSETYDFLRLVTINILKTVWGSEDVPQCFLWPVPPAKREEADYLPIELMRITASCRDPKRGKKNNWVFCGQCAECKTLKDVRHIETHPGRIYTTANAGERKAVVKPLVAIEKEYVLTAQGAGGKKGYWLNAEEVLRHVEKFKGNPSADNKPSLINLIKKGWRIRRHLSSAVIEVSSPEVSTDDGDQLQYGFEFLEKAFSEIAMRMTADTTSKINKMMFCDISDLEAGAFFLSSGHPTIDFTAVFPHPVARDFIKRVVDQRLENIPASLKKHKKKLNLLFGGLCMTRLKINFGHKYTSPYQRFMPVTAEIVRLFWHVLHQATVLQSAGDGTLPQSAKSSGSLREEFLAWFDPLGHQMNQKAQMLCSPGDATCMAGFRELFGAGGFVDGLVENFWHFSARPRMGSDGAYVIELLCFDGRISRERLVQFAKEMAEYAAAD